MSTITKEWLRQKIAEMESVRDEIPFGLDEDDSNTLAALRIALASLEAEAVADVVAWSSPNEERTCDVRLHRHDIKPGPLYTAQPAPVSVPDECYQHLSELYHAQEKRLFKLAQRIKGPAFDKYAHSPSQAIDVLESALFGENDEDCRAAMLQDAEPAPATDNTAQQFEALAGSQATVQPTHWMPLPAAPQQEVKS